MSWFSPRRPEPADPGRFDAVIARNIEAQRRTADAAEEVVQAADESREHLEAVVGAFKDRAAERRAARERAACERGIAAAVDDLIRLPSFGGPGDKEG